MLTFLSSLIQYDKPGLLMKRYSYVWCYKCTASPSHYYLLNPIWHIVDYRLDFHICDLDYQKLTQWGGNSQLWPWSSVTIAAHCLVPSQTCLINQLTDHKSNVTWHRVKYMIISFRAEQGRKGHCWNVEPLWRHNWLFPFFGMTFQLLVFYFETLKLTLAINQTTGFQKLSII